MSYSFETISYDNGKSFDNFNLGQIIAHFVQNEVGSQSFILLNELLKSSLTYTGVINLNDLYNKGIFLEYKDLKYDYPNLKYLFKEILVIDEFRSILSQIELEFKLEIERKEKLTKSYIRRLLNEILTKSSQINSLIKYEDASVYLDDKILNLLDLRS